MQVLTGVTIITMKNNRPFFADQTNSLKLPNTSINFHNQGPFSLYKIRCRFSCFSSSSFYSFFFQPQDFLLNYYMKHGQPFPNSGPHERWFIIRRVALMKKKNQINFWLKVKRPFSLPKMILVRIYLRIGGKN